MRRLFLTVAISTVLAASKAGGGLRGGGGTVDSYEPIRPWSNFSASDSLASSILGKTNVRCQVLVLVLALAGAPVPGGRRILEELMDESPKTPDPKSAVSRRDLFKLTLGGGAGLALGGLLDVSAVRAATKDLKLSEVSEHTTSCNFCSCGCGMIAAVRDGKLLKMEGDYDHIVNRGSLCVKGISMFATHASPQRLTRPRYRAPGSDRWQEISWDDAIARVAKKIRETRDRTWIATEQVDAPDLSVDRASGDRLQNAPQFIPHEGGKRGVPVNRTDAIGFMGGAQNTNEECYLFQKAARLLGMAYVEHQARL